MKPALACALLLALSACATVRPGASAPAAPESIAIAVGPCFGFCPVYDVTIAADGAVSFTGIRHTGILGQRVRRADPRTYRDLARDLAPFRPADGRTAAIPCAVAISDTPTYTITWTAPSGQAVATHRSGCREGAGRDLDTVLHGLPQRLGIEAWMRQTTRPGTSRG